MKTSILLLWTLISGSLAYGLHGERKKRSTLATICAGDNAVCDGDGNVCESGLTQAEKVSILNAHNIKRGGKNARNEMKMKWDDNLADLAQAWADQCVMGHGYTQRCDVTGSCGQNIYYKMTGSATANFPGYDGQAVVESWASEEQYYVYGDGCEEGHVCGHYTQVVWAKTSYVGCAYTNCPQLYKSDGSVHWQFPSLIVVCNYDPPGNYIGESPFEDGTPCTDCESVATRGYRCESNLCVHCTKQTDAECTCSCSGADCCQNGGAYNEQTCQCDCPSGYAGDQCQTSTGCTVNDVYDYCYVPSCPAESCAGIEDIIMCMCADMMCPPVHQQLC